MYRLDSTDYPKLSGIYKIINTINLKCYIGSAINLKTRLNRHKYELLNNIHNNFHLQKSFNKYGLEAFGVILLETFNHINYNTLLEIEKQYIIDCDSIKNGYNQLLDMSSFISKLNQTKSHVDKVSKALSKPVYAINILNGNIEYSFESIIDCARFFNTSSSNISRVCKEKLNYIKGYTFCYKSNYDPTKDYKKQHYRKDKKLSTEHSRKLKESLQYQFGKKVYQYNIELKLINIYPSMREAERCNNLKKECLKYKIDKETPFEGYIWKSIEINI